MKFGNRKLELWGYQTVTLASFLRFDTIPDHDGHTDRPVANNFQVGVLSLRVLGPGESEARRVEGDGGSWEGLPLRTS